MAPRDTAERLAAVAGRSACTDAERRAAVAVRDALRARGRAARLETVWVRPQMAQAHALHMTLGVAGSLAANASAPVGLGLLAFALVSTAGDLTGRAPLVRLLFPLRATQNVVSDPLPGSDGAPVRLVLAAALDVPHAGLAQRAAGPWAAARTALHGRLSSPLAVLTLCLALLTALAALRVGGVDGNWVAIASVPPTVALIAGFGALVDLGLSRPSPGASAAGGAAVALAVAEALDRRPPRNLAVEVVLAGAGEPGQLGMRAYVRARRRDRRPEEVAVLALGPCGAGAPHAHRTEGRLLPAALHPRLLAIARELGAPTVRHEVTPAWAARRARWPALGVSCRDARGRAPGAGTRADTVVDPSTLDAAVALCLGIVARLDLDLDRSAV